MVSPNYEHVKYIGQWAEAYPDATIYACPGLPDRMRAEAEGRITKGVAPSQPWGNFHEFDVELMGEGPREEREECRVFRPELMNGDGE